MSLKIRPLALLTLVALLAAALSACVLIPTPASPATPAVTQTPPLSPTDTGSPSVDTPIPTGTFEPTEDPSASLVDITQVKGISRLAMLDAMNGWALTDLGLLRTTNGGFQWRLANPPGYDIESNTLTTFFPDPNSAYLLTSGQDFSSGTLYQTTDAGRTWTNTSVPIAMGALQFVDAQNGFAMASLGAGAGSEPIAVYASQDGGLTWQKRYNTLELENPTQTSLGNGGIKSGFVFLDAQRGYITGSVPMEDYAYLFLTTDGGATWNHQDLPLPSTGVSNFFMLDEPVFFNDNDGLMTANQSPSDSSPIRKAFFVTHDAGATWTALPSIEGSGPVAAPTSTDWFFWNQTKLFVTHDAGQNWTEVASNLQLTEAPGTLVFSTPTNGWEIHYTGDGVIHFNATTDGGQTWLPIIP